MEGILVATAARTQNIQSDESLEAHQRPKRDYWGKLGSATDIPKETIIPQPGEIWARFGNRIPGTPGL
jgi:hypothetical protein